MTLGEFINTYITEHKISRRAFARLTGLSVTYISYLINGETQRGLAPVPSIDTYKVCAKAMGLDTDELVRMVDDDIAWGQQKNPTTANGDGNDALFAEMYSNFNQLPPEDREYIVSLINRLLHKGD